MRILADQNIPLAAEAFAKFGDVVLRPGRELTRDHVRQADALIVRSVTKVNRELLEGTHIRFVGTATIGTDHIDEEYLRERGIAFANAAGSNARSVVEWVLAALAEYCVERGEDWEEKTLGIVGHGSIGSPLAVRARGVGMNVLVNDPPRAREHENFESVPLQTLLEQSDFVSLHVPLTKEGQDPTYHLLDGKELGALKRNSVLINASRGPVLNNAEALKTRNDITLILDVFEGEPHPNRDLLRRSFLATPHIAGYSYDGKINGTQMMAFALSRFLNHPASWVPHLPSPPDHQFPLREAAPMKATLEAIRHSYPIREDDRRLREGLELSDGEWGQHFDQLRKNYPKRREFANYKVLNPPQDPTIQRRLRVLHFL